MSHVHGNDPEQEACRPSFRRVARPPTPEHWNWRPEGFAPAMPAVMLRSRAHLFHTAQLHLLVRRGPNAVLLLKLIGVHGEQLAQLLHGVVQLIAMQVEEF